MPHTHHPRTPVVVLVSGSGGVLQALIEASQDPSYGVQIVAVGADRDDIEGLARAGRAGLPTLSRASRTTRAEPIGTLISRRRCAGGCRRRIVTAIVG